MTRKGLVYNGAGPQKHSDTWIFELTSGRAKPKTASTTLETVETATTPTKHTTAKKTSKTRKRNS